jgi:putative oxidoreductase
MPLRAPDNCARHIVVLQARKEQMANSTRLRLPWDTLMLSVLRIVVGLLYLEHGTQKIFNFPPRPNPRPFELFTIVPGLAGVLELGGGILIVLGLFTRPVAFILSGEMAFAYFMSHAPRGFFPISMGGNGGELAILYCFTFLYFAFVGAGALSLDRLVWRTARPR